MDLAEQLRSQGEACGRLGSPMYAALLGRAAEDLASGVRSPVARVLRGHESDPGPSALALRLLGSVHRLVLSGAAPALAAYYPSVGGAWDLEAAWPAFAAVLEEHQDDLRTLLGQAPQTNEVGRSSALIGGLLLLADRTGLPVMLAEVGSSAGLNLHADRFHCTDEHGVGWGPPDSPVLLDRAWRGSPLPTEAPLRVVDRLGSDVAPIDVTTPEGALRLTSYVWPDQAVRLARLAGAVELAREHPAEVRTQDAAGFVEGLALRPGAVLTFWHSIMWQYVPPAQQQRVLRRLAELGERATVEQPLAHLHVEPVRRTPGAEHELLVCLERWPGGPGREAGEREVLGRTVAHGLPTTWELSALPA